jgi:SHAQKYF class myb-like DNA-binding protein
MNTNTNEQNNTVNTDHSDPNKESHCQSITTVPKEVNSSSAFMACSVKSCMTPSVLMTADKNRPIITYTTLQLPNIPKTMSTPMNNLNEYSHSKHAVGSQQDSISDTNKRPLLTLEIDKGVIEKKQRHEFESSICKDIDESKLELSTGLKKDLARIKSPNFEMNVTENEIVQSSTEHDTMTNDTCEATNHEPMDIERSIDIILGDTNSNDIFKFTTRPKDEQIDLEIDARMKTDHNDISSIDLSTGFAQGADDMSYESHTTVQQSGSSLAIYGEDYMRNKQSKDSTDQSSGRWTREEHQAFLDGLRIYGREWKKVARNIPTRTAAQIRSHAQKYFAKVAKDEKPQASHAIDNNDFAGLSPVVRERVERIMKDPEGAQQEVEETLRRLRNRYSELVRIIEEQQHPKQHQQPQDHDIKSGAAINQSNIRTGILHNQYQYDCNKNQGFAYTIQNNAAAGINTKREKHQQLQVKQFPDTINYPESNIQKIDQKLPSTSSTNIAHNCDQKYTTLSDRLLASNELIALHVLGSELGRSGNTENNRDNTELPSGSYQAKPHKSDYYPEDERSRN